MFLEIDQYRFTQASYMSKITLLVIVYARVLEAVGFSAASTASASDCRYFISSYPTHQIGSDLPLPKPWFMHV